VPIKFSLAFPIIFHTLSGFRHLVRAWLARSLQRGAARRRARRELRLEGRSPRARAAQIWDYTLRGIDNQSAELTSRALFATSLVSAAAAAAM